MWEARASAFVVALGLAVCGAGCAPTGESATGPTAVTASNRYAVTGMVREASNQQPIGGVRVQVTAGPDFGMSTVSDASGAFRFDALTSGRLLLELSKGG